MLKYGSFRTRHCGRIFRFARHTVTRTSACVFTGFGSSWVQGPQMPNMIFPLTGAPPMLQKQPISPRVRCGLGGEMPCWS